jgi:FG-GAP repeat protein
MNTDFTAVPDWFPDENAGTGIAVADINGDGFPDVAILMVDDPPHPDRALKPQRADTLCFDPSLS